MKKKTTAEKKKDFLFPFEELQYVKLPHLIIYHRKKSVIENRDLLGPKGDFALCGLGMTDDPKLFNGEIFRFGYFHFKESAQMEGTDGDLDPQDERMIRFVMAGVILGERRVIYQKKVGTPNIINVTDGQRQRLEATGTILFAWAKWWTASDFAEHCRKQNLSLIEGAAASLKSAGIVMSADALKKALKRLKLPL